MSKIKKALFEDKIFIIIFALIVINFTFSTLRDIETNGANADDKLTLYVYAVSQNLEEAKRNEIVNKVKKINSINCKNDPPCQNRLEMQINQNNTYPIVNLLINFFNKTYEKEEDQLTRISKSVHYGLILSQILFYLFFLIIIYKSPKNLKISVLIFLISISLIDIKIFNIDLSLFLPSFREFNIYTTEYYPRGIALFCGVISLISIQYRDYKFSFLFLIFSILYHFSFGLALFLIILNYYVIFFIIEKLNLKQEIIFKFFLILIFSLIFFLRLYDLFLLSIIFFLSIKYHNLNFKRYSFLLYLNISLIFLLSIYSFENFVGKLNNNEQHLNYLITIFQNFSFIIQDQFLTQESFNNFYDSYFYYFLRHIPQRIYPLIILSYIVILIQININLLNKLYIKIRSRMDFLNKNLKILIFLFAILSMPTIVDRITYVFYLSKKIPNEIEVALKKEGSYKLINKNINYKNFDFKNKEIYSFYLLSQIYKNDKN